MKINTKTDLHNFAESLAASLEEVASKMSEIESIINGNDEVPEEGDEEEVTEPEPEAGEEEYVEEPTQEAPAEQEFSEAKRYENVKNFLTL